MFNPEGMKANLSQCKAGTVIVTCNLHGADGVTPVGKSFLGFGKHYLSQLCLFTSILFMILLAGELFLTKINQIGLKLDFLSRTQQLVICLDSLRVSFCVYLPVLNGITY